MLQPFTNETFVLPCGVAYDSISSVDSTASSTICWPLLPHTILGSSMLLKYLSRVRSSFASSSSPGKDLFARQRSWSAKSPHCSPRMQENYALKRGHSIPNYELAIAHVAVSRHQEGIPTPYSFVNMVAPNNACNFIRCEG